jgi:DNA-binding transcriptional MerR regulator
MEKYKKYSTEQLVRRLLMYLFDGNDAGLKNPEIKSLMDECQLRLN